LSATSIFTFAMPSVPACETSVTRPTSTPAMRTAALGLTFAASLNSAV